MWSVQNRQIYGNRKQRSGCLGLGEGRVCPSGGEVSLGVTKWSKIRLLWWLRNSVNIRKTVNLHILKGYTLRYINYLPIKLLFKKMGSPLQKPCGDSERTNFSLVCRPCSTRLLTARHLPRLRRGKEPKSPDNLLIIFSPAWPGRTISSALLRMTVSYRSRRYNFNATLVVSYSTGKKKKKT